jgi:hypothetical protein
MYASYPPAFRFVGLWMCVGYLDLLKLEGLVTEDEQNGVWYYSAKPVTPKENFPCKV